MDDHYFITIVMPVFNERATLRASLERLLKVEFPRSREIIIVDDGSSDGCLATIDDLVEGEIRVIRHTRNRGKSAAIRTGLDSALGTYLTIYDADLEYDPNDLNSLIKPVLTDEANVVYGTRSFGSHTAYSFWFVLGNKFLALWASFLFDAWLSDVETCFKLAPTEHWRRARLRSSGFGIEAEATGRFLAMGERIYEVPISYRARGREEGKKLTWTDGLQAFWILLRIRLTSSKPRGQDVRAG